ncbi:uncharacterized protein LOC104585308 [Brachypodium distachyon]|uniref:uncharacterized protein LOC104585308 n=1 Tax=Brachypodium distachyon TaxID=15368 RepID=UPI000D0D407B|nr:uncharacterized protein LOC104585308 [Brachypodium distachyon]|eukprot:XP_024311985.1 uncharacterized protein LOC104585308 [Brachypodium distachyon]
MTPLKSIFCNRFAFCRTLCFWYFEWTVITTSEIHALVCLSNCSRNLWLADVVISALSHFRVLVSDKLAMVRSPNLAKRGLSRGRRDGAAAVGEEEAGSGDEVEQQHTDCYLIRIIFIGRISEWIDLDSEDEKLRLNTELKLKQEIAWASIT